MKPGPPAAVSRGRARVWDWLWDATPVPAAHPAVILPVLAVVACVVVSVSYKLYDTDLWQHLAVGREIWRTHAVPMVHLWTWPSYGQPQVLPSWGFRALLWPVWSAGGVVALFAWRWITTLVPFGLLWALARRMGARSLLPLVVITAAVLVYRERSMVRPETLVAALFACELAILEWRRHGGRDLTPWLPVVTCVWTNVHISWPLGLVLIAIYAADDLVTHRARWGSRARHWLLVTAGSLAACFVNPFGWRGLRDPFEYAWVLRRDPLMQRITELRPVSWSLDLAGPLGVLLLAWPLLLAWRFRRRGPDLAAALLCVLFTATLFESRRYETFYLLAVTPFVARDLEDWWGATVPAARRPSPYRSAIGVAVVCVALSVFVWSRDRRPVGLDFDWRTFPFPACDRIEAYGIGGRGFNQFELAGFMLYRFPGQRDRLPFMDIHQTGSAEDRRLCALAETDPRGWRALDDRHRFDYALLRSTESPTYRLLQYLDGDSAWACVFMDDAAALYTRKTGRMAEVARRCAFHLVPASDSGRTALGAACERDSGYRAGVARELERMTRESHANSEAHLLLANVALLDGDPAAARRHLDEALRQNPLAPGAHERLGLAALMEDRADVAVSEFRREAGVSGWQGPLIVLMANAYRRAGDRGRAAEWYRREIRNDPGDQEARDSLAVLERATR